LFAIGVIILFIDIIVLKRCQGVFTTKTFHPPVNWYIFLNIQRFQNIQDVLCVMFFIVIIVIIVFTRSTFLISALQKKGVERGLCLQKH